MYLTSVERAVSVALSCVACWLLLLGDEIKDTIEVKVLELPFVHDELGLMCLRLFSVGS